MKVLSIVESGFDGILAEVECHLSNGLPSIVIVGFATKAVDEAKERIRSAFGASSIPFPKKRITINLAPADVPKENSGFDLPIAISIMAADETIKPINGDMVLFGELGLDGSLRPIRGIIGKLFSARRHGIVRAIIPSANARQAALVTDMEIYPFDSLQDLYAALASGKPLIPLLPAKNPSQPRTKHGALDFSDVTGQQQAKRAMEIAAAGNHNILLNGPPGTGKSMLAKALPSILPPMTRKETLETTHLHSLGSKKYDAIVPTRPFRSPHHSASDTAIIGGGRNPKPGEISLSHNGVLFFDEIPEFRRPAIEALRQPLEDKIISVSRAKDTLEFPANFILVATANPCPCGFFGTDKACSCLPGQIQKYQRKLSGPILDRIDLYANVENVDHDKLLDKNTTSEPSKQIQQRVIYARTHQAKRFDSGRTNSTMTNQEIKTLAHVSSEAKALLNKAGKQLELSPRAYMRTIKVARTIADLDGSTTVKPEHIAEAIQYRPQMTKINI